VDGEGRRYEIKGKAAIGAVFTTEGVPNGIRLSPEGAKQSESHWGRRPWRRPHVDELRTALVELTAAA
jgi:hypothetical protein